MEKRFKQGAWNLLCLQTGVCLPSARSRESVCKSHELLFTKNTLRVRALSIGIGQPELEIFFETQGFIYMCT